MAKRDYEINPNNNKEEDWEHRKPQPQFELRRDPYWYGQAAAPESKGFKPKFSDKELQQLGFATFVITLIFGIGFSPYSIYSIFSGSVNWLILGMYLGMALVAAGSAFILHEMAHKVVAQKFGCWAEFRYNLKMLLITGAISLFASFFIIVPGAVYIRGHLTTTQNGLVSAAGPATNLALAVVFAPLFILGLFSGITIIQLLGFFGAFINCFLGAFNMIPLGNLDGSKIFRWNPAVWVAMMILLAGPVIVFYLYAFGAIG